MKRSMIIILTIALLVAFTTTSLGFVSVAVSSIKLSSADVKMQVGKTYTLKITITPANATNKKLTFSSDNKSIATVDTKGKIKGIKPGKTVITVASASNKKAVAKCNVTVSGIVGQTAWKEAFAGKKQVKLVIGGKFMSQYEIDKNWPYETAQALMDITNTDIKLKNYDDETILLWLASGDLPDLMMISNKYFKQMIEGGHVIPLNDLVKNAKNITDLFPLRVDFSKRFMSNGTGKLFFLPNKAGTSGWERRYGGGGFTVRWDLYKKIGMPKVENSDKSMLDLVEAMLKSYPQTKDGKKTYGMGFFNDWGVWAWQFMHLRRDGFYELGTPGYVANVLTSEIVNNYLNTKGSAFWNGMKYNNMAYRRGLVDPDSFTMKLDQYEAKCKAGQYVSSSSDFWFQNYGKEVAKKDPTSIEGSVFTLLVPGMNLQLNETTQVGSSEAICITKKCKSPERAVDLLNFTFSPDYTRLVCGGAEGKHWEYVNGVPTVMKWVTDLSGSDPNAYAKLGIWQQSLLSLAGNNLGVMHPDGYISGIINGPVVWKARNSAALTDFAKTYGFETQGEVFRDAFNKGIVTDYSKFKTDIQSAIPIVPDDVKRIDAKLDEIIAKAIPKLCLSENDAEYTANQAETIKNLKSAGAETAWNWWKTEWAKAKAYIDSIAK